MSKVRVPKELRPPERFKAFTASRGLFRVKPPGVFRVPRDGDIYWSGLCNDFCDGCDYDRFPRVILERVK